MKLKLDADGHAVLVDGKPVYTHDDGKEVPFDAPGAVATISRLNGEAKSHREAKEAAEAKAKLFEGLDDPEVARKAIETVKAFDDKKLVDAGKVEEVKRAAVAAAEEKAAAQAKAHALELKTITDKFGALESTYNMEKIGGHFKGSAFLTKAVKAPIDMVEAKFGRHFKIEDGKTVAYDSAGNKIYSRTKPGELADFEEAIENLIESYPQKDEILKGSNHSGADTKDVENKGNLPNGGKPITGFGGSKEERSKAIAQRFPELAKQ
jgi:hypothetical protein